MPTPNRFQKTYNLFQQHRLLYRAQAIALVLFFCLWGTLHLPPQTNVLAQEGVGTYTVAAGDSLSAIAGRYGVPVEALVRLNNITDASLIRVGQELLIPDPSTSANLGALDTFTRSAHPGESLLQFALRVNQESPLLSQLNGISQTHRLFPGQPIKLPISAATVRLAEPEKFGAIEEIVVPSVLIQGRTGRLIIDAARPISISATWNGLPLALSPVPEVPTEAVAIAVSSEVSPASGTTISTTINVTQAASLNAQSAITTPVDFASGEPAVWRDPLFALLPVPALIAPAPYPVSITYTARSGVLLNRTFLVNVVEGPYDSQQIILPDDKGGLLEPEIVDDELEKVTSAWSSTETPLRWTGIFSRPIGINYATTSPFGTRRSYNGGPYASYHAGQDYGAPAGVPVLAPAPGIVVLAEGLNVRGNAVILDHGRGIFSGYWHLSELNVAVGQEVATGDLLGLVGTTGLSTGAHLHWELRIYGIAVDPLQFIEEPLISQ